MDSGETREWLPLRQTADLLGVHPATVRSWADAGRLPHIRTPGGHRRFSRAELETFLARQHRAVPPDKLRMLTQSAIGYARQRMSQGDVATQAWHTVPDETYHQQKRLTGQRMMGLIIQHVGRQVENDLAVKEGRQLSQEYGRDAAQRGLSLTDAVQAFLFFRDTVVQATFKQVILDHKFTEEDLALYMRMNHFLNKTLLAMVEAYEETEME